MIKFFRKIRQNLLMENKTSKYFKYAVGEILLVVIGILIALQINNWNEQQKQNNMLSKYYKNLVHEFDGILQNFEAKIIPDNDFLIEELETSLNLIKNKPTAYKDSLLNHLGAIGTAWGQRLNTPVLDKFNESGLLNEIKVDTIKNAIVKINLFKDNLETNDFYTTEQYLQTLEPYLLKNMNYSQIALKRYRKNFIAGGPSTNIDKIADSLELWNMLTIKLETCYGQKKLWEEEFVPQLKNSIEILKNQYQ